MMFIQHPITNAILLKFEEKPQQFIESRCTKLKIMGHLKWIHAFGHMSQQWLFGAFLRCLRSEVAPRRCAAEEHCHSNSPIAGSRWDLQSWDHQNNPLLCVLPSAQYDDVNGHSELVIERVSKDDSGTYVCTAENTVGSIKAIGFVYVKGM